MTAGDDASDGKVTCLINRGLTDRFAAVGVNWSDPYVIGDMWREAFQNTSSDLVVSIVALPTLIAFRLRHQQRDPSVRWFLD